MDDDGSSEAKQLREESDSDQERGSCGGLHDRATEAAKRLREESHSDQDDGGCTTSPVRRGVRTSFFRRMGTPKSLSLGDSSPVHSSMHSPMARTNATGTREPLEILLSASEEGDLATVQECLERPDAMLLVNLHGHARNILLECDADSGRPSEWGHPESLTCYRGDTALGYAAFHGYPAIVRALLVAGSVAALRNDVCQTALALAEVCVRVP